MIILKCILINLFIIGVVLSCPFLHNGRIAQQLIEERKSLLMANGFRVDLGDPGHIFLAMHPIGAEVQTAYNKSVALLQSHQFHVDNWQRKYSNTVALDYLWKSAEKVIPRNERCRVQPKCGKKQRFATATGECNNLRIPLQGASYTPYGRLLDAHFDDGFYSIRKSSTKRELPSPRLLGQILTRMNVYRKPPRRLPNHGSLMFGQYIAHDMGLKNIYQDYKGGNSLRCCAKDYRRPLPKQFSYFGCEAIAATSDDPFYAQFGGGCIEFMRSQPVFGNTCKLGPAELSNSVTHYMDHSPIYGSTQETVNSLRSFTNGKMLIHNGIVKRKPNCTGEYCYTSGDKRSDIYPTISLVHSIFVRLHNVIATGLSRRNGRHWNDERLFQETRRLVTAVYQSIAYNEWLPLYLGRAAAERRNVSSTDPDIGYSGYYHSTVDASNLNEFGNAAFRLFHTNIPETINMYDQRYRLNEVLPLNRSMHGLSILERQYNGMMRGFFKDPIHIGKYPNHIRNSVFSEFNKNDIGLDLLAIDVMRGRDHGTRPYHDYLRLVYPGRQISNWNDLKDIFSEMSLNTLKSTYESVHDVDLIIGLTLEEKRGTLVGPVTSYLIEEQFYRSKHGDRFFYALANNPYPFTRAQLGQINRMGWANVICAISNIREVPQLVFNVLGTKNSLIKCPDFMINLDLWAV